MKPKRIGLSKYSKEEKLAFTVHGTGGKLSFSYEETSKLLIHLLTWRGKYAQRNQASVAVPAPAKPPKEDRDTTAATCTKPKPAQSGKSSWPSPEAPFDI
jgi:hypothetical protein